MDIMKSYLIRYQKKNQHSDKESLTLVHIGSIYNGRNIKEFIKGLIKFSNTTKRKINFNVVGFLDNQAKRDIETIKSELNKSNVKLNIIGTVDHSKAIEYLINSDISVVLTHIKGSNYAIPGKTFECIGAEKPIIAITEDKCLIDLIDKKYGECSKHDSNEIEEKLHIILNSTYDFSDKVKFTREEQARRIIQYLLLKST